MRAWTLGVSIVVHLCFITGVLLAPLFATDELPTPPRITEFVRVVASVPEPPPPPRPLTPTPSRNLAPIDAPDHVAPEPPPVPDVPPGPDFGVPGGDPDARPFVPGGPVEGDLVTPPPPPPPPPAPRAPVRPGGVIRAPQKIKDVAARYPAIAQASRVEGVVILDAVIGEDGGVRDVRVLRSQPLLDAAAVEAVRQWRFTPTLLNGQPIPVVMTVTVVFKLN